MPSLLTLNFGLDSIGRQARDQNTIPSVVNYKLCAFCSEFFIQTIPPSLPIVLNTTFVASLTAAKTFRSLDTGTCLSRLPRSGGMDGANFDRSSLRAFHNNTRDCRVTRGRCLCVGFCWPGTRDITSATGSAGRDVDAPC